MATVTPLASGSHLEHRGFSFWMDRVVGELENVRSSPDPDAVHDLRVAIRRCRSVAAVMEEVDSDPPGPPCAKSRANSSAGSARFATLKSWKSG